MPPYQMNPVNDFFLRQPYQQQFNFPPHQQNIPQINCRFVTNKEEAKAAMIDGVSYNVFLDSGNGKIYLKKLNNNGLSDFLTYAIEEEKNISSDPIHEINTRLSNIENFLGGLANDKSVPGNTGVQQSAGVSQPAATEQVQPNGSAEPAGISKNAGNDQWKKRR